MDLDYVNFDSLSMDIEERVVEREITADQHLASPIRPDLLILIRDALILHPSTLYDPVLSTSEISYVQLPNIAVHHKDLLLKLFDNITPLMELLEIDGTYVYGELLQLGCGTGSKKSSWYIERIPIVTDVLKEHVETFMPELLSEMSAEWTDPTDEIIKIYTSKMYWEDMKQDMINMTMSKSDTWKLRHTTCKAFPYIIINRSIGLLLDIADTGLKQQSMDDNKMRKIIPDIRKIYMLSYEQIMMVSDTIASRFFTLSFLRSLSEKFEFKCEPEIVKRIYSIGDEEFKISGNAAYTQFKMFEAVVHCMIINKVDTIEIDPTYREYLNKEIKDNNYHTLEKIKEELEKLNYLQLIEIFGLYRHWGHPIVSESKGCEKITKIALSRPLPDFTTTKKILGCIIRQYCHSYIIQHGRWPRLDTSKLPSDSQLLIFVNKGITNINLESISLPLEHWAELEPKQEFFFDYSDDYTVHLSDKSIAPIKSENSTSYDFRMAGYNRYKKRSTTKRVLTEILQRSEVDIEKICSKVINRSVPDDWNIIKLSSKERELNNVPRLFAMMVLDMRLYFCATESNISRTIFKYFPQQSMTSSEAKLAYRLQQVGSKGEGSFVEVLIGIDFKNWNIHWTYGSTFDVFNFLDKVFGTPGLYTYTHEFFQKSEISLSSTFRIPDEHFASNKRFRPNDAQYKWTNHLGGFEGLRQKGWTLCTIGLLLLVEVYTGIKSSIIGQGDNQICKIRIKVPDRKYDSKEAMLKENILLVRMQVRKFMECLMSLSDKIGLVVKPLETWISHSVLAYGKEFTVNGAFCSQTLKRISRSLPDVNELYPTIQNKVATLQTSGLTTAQKSMIMAVPYVECQKETLLTLIRDIERLKYLKNSKISKSSIKSIESWINTRSGLRFILLTNSDCFGLPIAHLTDYMYRGHPDHLTSYLTLLMIFAKNRNPNGIMAKNMLSWFKQRKYPLGIASEELLISNPTSTNISRVDPVSSYFKKYVIDHIVSTCRNKDVSEMFNKGNQEFDSSLYKYLLEFTPVFPRVLHEIASNTPTGSRLAFVSQFSSTRTLQSLSREKGAKSLSQIMLSSDAELVFDLYKRYQSIMATTHIETVDCPTLLAQDMRDHSWESILSGKSIEGVTVPHPLHLFKVVNEDVHDTISREYFSILAPKKLTLDDLYKCGTAGMYVGNKTQEKKSGKVLVVENYCKPLESSVRLSQIQQWCINEECPAYNYMEYLMSLKTNFPPETIRLCGGEIEKGTFYHRLNDHMTKMSSLNNMRHTLTTHFVFSSDNLKLVSRGGEDYNIHMQGLILLGFRLKIIELINTGTVSRYTKLAVANTCCIEEITNQKLVNNKEGPTVKIINNQNRLLFADRCRIKDVYQPVSDMIKMINETKPEHAMASYLLSQLYKTSMQQTWSTGDTKVAPVSAIGVSELMQTDILDICRELAMYIILYFESSSNDVQSKIQNLASSFWGGISENALLPEVLQKIIQTVRVDGIADLYTNTSKLSLRLNQIVSRHISQIHTRVNKLGKDVTIHRPVFFITEGISVTKIIRMWNYSNYLRGLYSYSNWKRISVKITEIITSSYPSKKNMTDLHLEMNTILGSSLMAQIVDKNPMLILKRSPEMYFRNRITIRPIQNQLKHGPIMLPTSVTDKIRSYPYPRICIFGADILNSCDKVIEDVSKYYALGELPSLGLRMRADHAYRQYDTISTAHSKITQIIIKEGIDLNGESVCTADGESSIGYVIHKMSQRPIYYNSLFDTSKIIPQRYEHYVPGSFLRDRDAIKGAKLCVIYGGDLLDPVYLNKFLEILPRTVPLLTNDAEISGQFHPAIEHKMHMSMLTIIMRCKPNAVIKKCYLHNIKLLSLHLASYLLYYDDVHLVVPTYSSNEGKECYIVCKGLKMILPDHNLNMNSTYLPVISNHLAIYVKLSDFARTRNDVHPFQKGNLTLTAVLMKAASIMGFENNYTESFNRYFMMMNSNLDPAHIEEDMKSVKHYNDVLLRDIIKSTASSYAAVPITMLEGIETSGPKKTHIEYDRISIRKLNWIILYKTIHIKNQQEAYKELLKCLNMKIELRQNNIKIYHFKIENTTVWATEYLKHYWKIWGHINQSMSVLITNSGGINERFAI